MKRLLCILDSLDTGGAETFMMKIYRKLDKEQYQMDFVVCKNGFYDDEVRQMGGKIFVIPLRTKHFLKSFSMLRRIVKENSYKSVLKLGTSPIVVFDLLAVKLGGAEKICLRSCNAPKNVSKKQEILNFMLRPFMNRLANVKLAPSDLAGRYTFGDKLYEKGDVVLLKNALDLEKYRYSECEREKIRKELCLGDSFAVGHIGRFVPQKNHKFLISVFSEFKRCNPNSKLVLVGTGPLETDAKRCCDELNISDSVIFAGVRNDIPSLLSAFDIFLLPSLYEGMPNTVIEAQASGLLCIISDAITKQADVTDGVTYVSLQKSPNEWARLILESKDKPRMENGEKMREEGYSIEDTVRIFIELCYK